MHRMDKIWDSHDPPLVANEIQKLYEIIWQKKNDLLILKEMEHLKNLCGHHNSLVNLSACNAVLRLVNFGRIDLLTAYSWLSSCIFTAKNLNGLLQLTIDLFTLDIANQKGNAKLAFSKHSQQHPLVEILKRSDRQSFPVLVAIQSICYSPDPNKKAAVTLLKPVFEFIFSCKTLSFAFCNAVWDILIDLEEAQLITEFLSQLTLMTDAEQGFKYLHIVCKLLEKDSDSEFSPLIVSVIPVVASVIQYFVENGLFLDKALKLLLRLTTKNHSLSSLVLMILAEAVRLCSLCHLSPLLNICLNILKITRCSTISEHMLVASFTQWLLQPTSLVFESHEIASEIIELVFSRKDFYHPTIEFCNNYTFLMISASHKIILKTVFLHRLGENVLNNPDLLAAWLDSKNAHFEEFIVFLSGLLISTQDKALKEQIIRNLCNVKPDQQLAILVLQLAREKDPKVQSKLLSSLHFCISKDNQENKLIVLQILKGLSSSRDSVLREQSIYQYFLFWKVERRCFPFLHSLLVSSDTSCEIDLTKAKVINEICKISPEIYGKNVARPISDILNKSQSTHSCALALNSIVLLCKAGEIDIQSTWNAIKPKFINERRPEIVKCLCEILSLVPNFYSPLDSDKQDLFTETMTTLWGFVMQNFSEKITCAALRAFSSFKLEHLSLETLPDIYKENAEKAIRASLAKSVAEFVFIPGKCWLKVLETLPAGCHNEAVALFTKWLNDEIATFHSGIYSKVLDEPTTYTFLQERSLCRSFVDYIRKHSTIPITENVQSTLCLCLQILSNTQPKPVPPLKWNFLSKYTNESPKQLKIYSTKLVIKQANHKSSSAINILEAKLSNMVISDKSEEEVRHIFETLNGIYHSVHSTTLQGFVNNSFQYAAEEVKQNQITFYCSIVDSIGTFLSEYLPGSDEFFSKTLHYQWNTFWQVSACSDCLIQCISVLSDHCINATFPLPENGLSSHTSSSNFHPGYIKLVCRLASIKRTPESIDRLINLLRVVCSKRLGIDNRTLLQNELLPVFMLPLQRVTVLFFVKSLMALVESCEDENLEYLCSILIKVIILSTGLSYFPADECSHLPLYNLPFALTLFEEEELSSFQGFFSKMSDVNAHEISISYSILFKQCLIILLKHASKIN